MEIEEFYLQYNSSRLLLFKSSVCESLICENTICESTIESSAYETRQNPDKIQAIHAFNKLIGIIEKNTDIVVYDITYHYSKIHNVKIIYYQKNLNLTGSLLQLEKEYESLEELNKYMEKDFINFAV